MSNLNNSPFKLVFFLCISDLLLQTVEKFNNFETTSDNTTCARQILDQNLVKYAKICKYAKKLTV